MNEGHWHVGENVPGYLPESDVDRAETRAAAVELLKARKAEWIDSGFWQWNDQPELKGRNRYVIEGDAARDLGYTIEDRLGGPYHLGYVIWASGCHDPDCEDVDR